MKEEEPLDPVDFLALEEEGSDREVVARLESTARLQELYDKERDGRLEERFLWVCVCTIMFNIIAAPIIDNAFFHTILLILQMVMLLTAAQMWGIDAAVRGLGWFIHWLSNRFNIKR